MINELTREIEELFEEKLLLMKEFFKDMQRLNESTDKVIDRAMREHPQDLEGEIGILDKFKGLISFSKKDTLNILEKDGLKYADLWTKRKQEDYEHLRSLLEKNHQSLIEDLDNTIKEKKEQIDYILHQIKVINEQIERETDDEIRRELEKRKRNYFERGW